MAQTTKRSGEGIPYVEPENSSGHWKYDPVRKFDYVSTGQGERPVPTAVPFVTVKRRSDGQYVVVEKYPGRLKPVGKLSSSNYPWSQIQMDPMSEVKFRSIRPDWRYATRGNFHRTNGDLPPIDLGWNASSKIRSLENYYHQPGGGDKAIPKQSVRWRARAKVGSWENIDYQPRTLRAMSDPLPNRPHGTLPALVPRYGALANTGSFGNIHYTPGGATVIRPKGYEHVKPKVQSLDFIDHVPQGGQKRIPNFKINWKSKSKVGSLDNAKHQAGGGDVLFLQEKLHWKSKAKVGSLENADHSPRGGNVKVPNFKLNWRSGARIGSLANVHHVPGGGDMLVHSEKLRWNKQSKVNSLPKKKKEKFLGSSDEDVNADDY